MMSKVGREGLEHPGCITLTRGFDGNCLNHGVLEASVYEYVQNVGRLGDDEPINE